MHRESSPTPYHDVFWIFALWRALHGGDPTLADVAASVIASLAQFLPAREDSFGLLPLPPSPMVLAPQISDEWESGDLQDMPTHPGQHQLQGTPVVCHDPHELSIHHYYFNFKGVFYRLDHPAFACLPAAA